MVVNNMKELAIQTGNLTVSFNGTTVIDNQSMQFAKGEVSVLIGRSGSGKTTLLRSFNRLNECLDGCRTSGTVSANLDNKWTEIHSSTISPEMLRRRIGMVFQTPNALPTSIRNNIILPLKLAMNVKGTEAEARMEHALKQADLWKEVQDRMDKPAQTLSGGQQQRLCIARALALQPEILLLDEPSASLDFHATRTIEDLLLELKSNYTVIVVSHSLSQAQRLADTLYIFKSGQLTQTLNPEEFLDNVAFQQAIETLF